MTTDRLFLFNKELKKEGMIFCYSGPVSQGLIEEIGEVIQRKIELAETKMRIIQIVFGIFVEQVQNMMNYSDEREEYESGSSGPGSGIVVIGKHQQEFYILCGNLIENSNMQKLQDSLKAIEGKSKAQLKSMYKEKLKEGRLEFGKGAGLGIIDIARKASEPLEYNFKKLDSKHTFFSSRVVIKEDKN